MKKIKWLLPTLGLTTVAAAIPMITACSASKTKIEYVGGDKSFTVETPYESSSPSGSEYLYFKITKAETRYSVDTITLSVLNQSNSKLNITFGDVKWLSYANGEFSVLLKWEYKDKITSDVSTTFDIRVEYTNPFEISACADITYTGFSAGFKVTHS